MTRILDALGRGDGQGARDPLPCQRGGFDGTNAAVARTKLWPQMLSRCHSLSGNGVTCDSVTAFAVTAASSANDFAGSPDHAGNALFSGGTRIHEGNQGGSRRSAQNRNRLGLGRLTQRGHPLFGHGTPWGVIVNIGGNRHAFSAAPVQRCSSASIRRWGQIGYRDGGTRCGACLLRLKGSWALH